MALENYLSFLLWGSLRVMPHSLRIPLWEVTQLSLLFFPINISHKLGRIDEVQQWH